MYLLSWLAWQRRMFLLGKKSFLAPSSCALKAAVREIARARGARRECAGAIVNQQEQEIVTHRHRDFLEYSDGILIPGTTPYLVELAEIRQCEPLAKIEQKASMLLI
jgi:hypothetical protein